MSCGGCACAVITPSYPRAITHSTHLRASLDPSSHFIELIYNRQEAARSLVAILSSTEVSAEGSDGPEGLRERGQQLPVDFSKAQTEPLLITTNTSPGMNYAFLV